MPTSAPKSFRTQFFELATGMAMAQAASLALMPLISRLYLPEDMGVFSLYVSISSILGVLANLRLDQAVVIADDTDEGSRLSWLGIGFSFLFGIFTLVGLSILRGFNSFAVYTAASVFLIGSIQTLVNWHSARKNFRLLASRSFGEKMAVLVTSIACGWWGYKSFGLIIGQTAGLIISICGLFWFSGLESPARFKGTWKKTLNKFAEFPSKNLPSVVLLASSLYAPTLLFGLVFAKADIGIYSLANRVFEVPINLVAYTFSTVYYQHSNGLANDSRLRLFCKSLKILCFFFLPAFAVAALFSPQIFTLVFGANWTESGVLAQYLAPYTFVRLLFTSQASLLLVGRKLNVDLLISTLLFLAQVVGFAIGYFAFGTISACIAIMAALGSTVYIFGLVLTYRTLRA